MQDERGNISPGVGVVPLTSLTSTSPKDYVTKYINNLVSTHQVGRIEVNEMQTYELSAIWDSRKSFYGKARVKNNDGDLELISYNTRVAVVYPDGTASVYGTYSSTTLRHIKEFLLQNGFKAENKKQILKDYGIKTHTGELAVS